MKEIFEAAVSGHRFNMNGLHAAVWPRLEASANCADNLTTIRESLNPADYRRLGNALLRNAYLIEPMLTRGGATKMTVRWVDGLAADQRYCSFEDCTTIAEDLIRDLAR